MLSHDIDNLRCRQWPWSSRRKAVGQVCPSHQGPMPPNIRVDSRFAPSQWETALLCNDVSPWLGANLESTLNMTGLIVVDHVDQQTRESVDKIRWYTSSAPACGHHHDATWAYWRLNTPATRLFIQGLVETDIKVSHYSPLVRGIHWWPVPSQRASNVENVSMSLYHHDEI